jgi:hypothetical protein
MALTNTQLSFIPSLTSLIGIGGTMSDIERQADATIKTLESMATTQAYTQTQKQYQLEQLTEVLGEQLSLSGLESLKREATLKAAAAETGATQTEIIEQTFVEENLRNAQYVRENMTQKDSLKMSMIADRLNFENQANALRYSMLTPLSAGLKTLGSGMSGFNMGLNFLGTGAKNIALGIDTTGTKV